MEPHERLNEAMNRRRLELRRHWKQVAADAGISTESLSAIRRGDNRPSELTAHGIDTALGWESGSTEDIYKRGLPPRLRDAPAEHQPAPTDLETYVGQTPMEQVLLEVLRSDRAAYQRAAEGLQQQLRELNAKVDRLAPQPPADDNGNPEHDQQIGA